MGLYGVEERTEVMAVRIQKQARVFDLEKCELRYAPSRVEEPTVFALKLPS